MNITSISIHQIGIIITLAFISVILLTISLLINIAQPKHKKHLTINIAVFILNCLNLAGLLELNRVIENGTYNKTSYIGSIINNIPYIFQYLFIFASIGFVVFEFYNMWRFEKKELSIFAVKEAIKDLPLGLAFYNENGFLYLSNRIMNTLSLELTEKDLQNGVELINDLKSMQGNKNCLIQGEKLAFELSNGSIWQFASSKIIVEGKEFTELRADDITEIYHLSDDIRETNERLKAEKIRLGNHMKNIEKLISEEETLRVKMLVHDDFGELITKTVRDYERGISKENKEELINDWAKLGKKMKHIITYEQKEEPTLEKALIFAKKLNCKLVIKDELPKEEEYKDLILCAIRECLKNAVYHAYADVVTVKIENFSDKYTILIYNEDKDCPKTITYGGGLSSLDNKTKELGGKMKVICANGEILIKLELKKNHIKAISEN